MSDDSDPTCPFCRRSDTETVATATHAVAIRDLYPLTDGHTLIVPRRHVETIFDLDGPEWADVWGLVRQVRSDLIRRLNHPDGFNVGVNDGVAAGQTVGHAHIHVIPRWQGDVVDPRGGVRWVVPRKAAYWDWDADG